MPKRVTTVTVVPLTGVSSESISIVIIDIIQDRSLKLALYPSDKVSKVMQRVKEEWNILDQRSLVCAVKPNFMLLIAHIIHNIFFYSRFNHLN